MDGAHAVFEMQIFTNIDVAYYRSVETKPLEIS